MKFVKLVLILTIIFLQACCQQTLSQKAKDKDTDSIPFQDSLQEADVTLTKMQDGQRESLILGNGDLYGIVWIKDNGLFMRITKNDIWDARVDTSKDGKLPHVDIVTHKITGHVGAPRSYSFTYPQPRCATALRLGAVPKEMSARLEIGKGTVIVNSAGQAHTTLRILYDRNVLLVKSPNTVTLEEIKAKTLPDAKLGTTGGVSWLLMKMPGDIDYKGMEYALAVTTKGDLKAVSLVTSFDIDGLHVPISSFLHEPNPAHCKSKNKRQMSMNPWGLTIGLQAMTFQNMWQKYLCDQDVKYMREKIYPFLKEVATFYVSFMEKCQKDDNGKILLGPSFSPEHPPMGIFNCPFDIGYVHYAFDAMIEAGTLLKTDKKLVRQCRKYKKLLADYPTMIHNGQEIVVDSQGGDYIKEHNITVPAAPVFPCDQVTWFSSDSEKELFKRTIKATRFRNANAHVMFNIARARLSMPEGFTEAKKWFASRELPNGLFVWAGHGHGTFMGEMIGIAGLIDEFLLQSVQNKIRLSPCWPGYKDAKFTRLRAQGGFIVSAEFKDGRVASATIESVADKKLQLLSPWKTIYVNGRKTTIGSDGLVTLNTKPGQVFKFSETSN